MNIMLDVQRVVTALPTDKDLMKWVKQTLNDENISDDDIEMTIRFVDENESAQLNEKYRHQQSSTNVLSFPFDAPAEVELNLLGDLVVCADVVKIQAKEQKKEELAHWAHMVVHGTLHLLGYDHVEEKEANIMEEKEIQILSLLGYSDPYREN